MAGSQFTVSLLLTLQDRLSAGLGRSIGVTQAMGRALKGTSQEHERLRQQWGKQVGGGSYERAHAGAKQATAATRDATREQNNFRRAVEKLIRAAATIAPNVESKLRAQLKTPTGAEPRHTPEEATVQPQSSRRRNTIGQFERALDRAGREHDQLRRTTAKGIGDGGYTRAASGAQRFTGSTRAARREHEEFRRSVERPVRASRTPPPSPPRGRRDSSRSIAGDLRDDLVTGAAGYGALRAFGSGMTAASDYEGAVLNLRGAYQEASNAGGLSAQQQEDYLTRLSALAKNLGNDLQGNTGDYAGILASLKRAGVGTETVLNGAGRSAAYLANVSGALLDGRANEQAKELGQFGIAFKLRPDDFEKQVNLISALQDRFDLESSELMQGAKYFAPTASSLKMTGAKGAADTSYLFAALKRQGLEGGLVGTNASAFFQQYLAHGEKRETIRKETGVDIKLFDKKGEFLGLENAFKQMEQLRKFSSEQRLSILNDIFGSEGGRVGGAMVELGAEGYRKVAIEAGKAVSVNEKITQQMATYAAKSEAAQGSWENLKATAFTPILGAAKPALDKTNELLGTTQELAAEHPNVAMVGTAVLSIAGVALTAAAGISALRTVTGLWRISAALAARDTKLSLANASATAATGAARPSSPLSPSAINNAYAQRAKITYQAYAASQRGVVGESERAAAATTRAGRASAFMARGFDAASTKATALKGRISAVSNSAAGSIAIMTGLAVAVDKFTEARQEYAEADSAAGRSVKDAAKSGERFRENAAQHGQAVPASINYMEAQGAFATLDYAGAFKATSARKQREMGFYESIGAATFRRGEYNNYREAFNTGGKSTEMARNAPQLKTPEIMAEFRKMIAESKQFQPVERERVEKTLAATFPESYKVAVQQQAEAMQRVNAETGNVANSLSRLMQPSDALSPALFNVLNPASILPGALGSVTGAAQSFAYRLNSLQIEPPRFQPIQIPTFGAPQQPAGSFGLGAPGSRVMQVPSRAIGGVVQRDGLAQLHAGNLIVPAREGRRLINIPQSSRAVGGVVDHGTRATVYGGNITPAHITEGLTVNNSSIVSMLTDAGNSEKGGLTVPSRSIGGFVKSKGAAMLHAGNIIIRNPRNKDSRYFKQLREESKRDSQFPGMSVLTRLLPSEKSNDRTSTTSAFTERFVSDNKSSERSDVRASSPLSFESKKAQQSAVRQSLSAPRARGGDVHVTVNVKGDTQAASNPRALAAMIAKTVEEKVSEAMQNMDYEVFARHLDFGDEIFDERL